MINAIQLIFDHHRPFLQNKNDPKMKPLGIDFADYNREMTLGSGGRKLILNAIGKAGNQGLSILDATAGLARDAFFMAKFGCDVTLIERSAPLVTLIEYAIAHNQTQTKLSLMPGDAIALIPTLPRFDVIYLDPMFNSPPSKSKVKKDLQILQLLHHGDHLDESKLLEVARHYAKKRVVVKRERTAPPLAGATPHSSIMGKTLRLDVYPCL